jgi:hypothetical protein
MARITTTVAVVVYPSRLFNITGNVGRWASSVHRKMVFNSIQEAPARSGELRAGIGGSNDRTGPQMRTVTIFSTAPHSLFVLQGTTGPIYANRYWSFKAKNPHLRGPRAAMLDPTRPLSTGIDWLAMKRMGYMLRVRAGNGHAERWSLRVSGQTANPFFARAAAATARRHSSLRGWNPQEGGARFH